MGQITETTTTKIFFDRHTQQTDITHLAPQVHRKLIRTVNFRGTRGDLDSSKFAHCVAQCGGVIAMIKAQSR